MFHAPPQDFGPDLRATYGRDLDGSGRVFDVVEATRGGGASWNGLDISISDAGRQLLTAADPDPATAETPSLNLRGKGSEFSAR